MWNYKLSSKREKNKLGTKKLMVYLGLSVKKSKNVSHICNQRPPICLTAKFHLKTGILKCGTKNASFGQFLAGIWKECCYFWNQQSRACLIAKFRKKVKMPKFGTKTPYLGIYGLKC